MLQLILFCVLPTTLSYLSSQIIGVGFLNNKITEMCSKMLLPSKEGQENLPRGSLPWFLWGNVTNPRKKSTPDFNQRLEFNVTTSWIFLFLVVEQGTHIPCEKNNICWNSSMSVQCHSPNDQDKHMFVIVIPEQQDDKRQKWEHCESLRQVSMEEGFHPYISCLLLQSLQIELHSWKVLPFPKKYVRWLILYTV